MTQGKQGGAYSHSIEKSDGNAGIRHSVPQEVFR
jgi:hypothetical protein